MYSREQVRSDLTSVIVAELERLNIDPQDSTKVTMHAQEIWQALVRSGKMPRILSFDDMMNGMTHAALSVQFHNIFGRRR